MLRFLFLCCGLLFAIKVLAAESVLTHIEEMDTGTKGADTLFFLGNGKVAKLSASEKNLLKELTNIHQQKLRARFELDDDRHILNFTLLPHENISVKADIHSEKMLASYQPTFIESLKKAQELFKQMRRGSLEDSQCYNRAHVWAYDWKREFDINSMKMWIFFTRKYIRAYNFEWWFHVAPFLYVDEANGIMERVMDHKFTHTPLYLKDWTDKFMRNKAKCPIVQGWSKYDKENSDKWCYVMKSNMYYYQPLDILNLEKEGEAARKAFFMNWEVRNAYQQAFGLTIE